MKSKFEIIIVLAFLFCGCQKPDVEKVREWKVIPDRPYLDVTEIKEFCILDSNFLAHIPDVYIVTCPILEKETLDRLNSYSDSVFNTYQDNFMVAITHLGEEKMEILHFPPRQSYFPEGTCLFGRPRYGHYYRFVSEIDFTDHYELVRMIQEEKIPITHFPDEATLIEERRDYFNLYVEYMREE